MGQTKWLKYKEIFHFRESMIEVSATFIDEDFAEITPAQVDWHLDESFDEFAEFDNLATEFHRVFPKQMGCVAHSLQLPLRKVVDTDSELAAVRKDVFALLSKFSKSETAMRLLLEKCGLKLILPGITRWNSICITYERLLHIREAVDQVCVECGWATLGETYEKVEIVRDLLRPFLDYTDFIQGEQYPTVSSIIPTLLSLLIELESPAVSCISILSETEIILLRSPLHENENSAHFRKRVAKRKFYLFLLHFFVQNWA